MRCVSLSDSYQPSTSIHQLTATPEPVSAFVHLQERTTLQSQLTALQASLTSEREKSKEAEKEQEDLLVLLDELSTKRARDKERMRERGMEVSEDEGDDDEEEEEGDEE